MATISDLRNKFTEISRIVHTDYISLDQMAIIEKSFSIIIRLRLQAQAHKHSAQLDQANLFAIDNKKRNIAIILVVPLNISC